MDKKKTLLICGVILAAGGLITLVIFLTEPTAQRTGATKETAMLVEVTDIERDTFRPTIQVLGTVEPSRDITLSPRVSGEIVQRAPAFTPGAHVQKGEVLLQIDPSDYKAALQQRKSELQQALAGLEVEEGQQNVARQDYRLLNDTLSPERKALVLRKPQLKSAQSDVQSARAEVRQAKLNLDRTTIKAPFDAQILSRNVNVGSQVAPGEDLGRLVGVDEYWVAATVPLSKIRWLRFPDTYDEKGAKVRIRNRTAWDKGTYRIGHLHKMVGTLDDRTRMARVLITVKDPLGYGADTSNTPVLMIGSYVEANIRAKPLHDVVRLNRDYIRQDETVWVMDNEKLRIRDVNIVFRDNRYAYINEGLDEQNQVVTTNLATVRDGARLRLKESKRPQGTDTSSTQSTARE